MSEKQPSGEQRAEFEKSRTISDAELLENGGQYVIDKKQDGSEADLRLESAADVAKIDESHDRVIEEKKRREFLKDVEEKFGGLIKMFDLLISNPANEEIKNFFKELENAGYQLEFYQTSEKWNSFYVEPAEGSESVGINSEVRVCNVRPGRNTDPRDDKDWDNRNLEWYKKLSQINNKLNYIKNFYPSELKAKK